MGPVIILAYCYSWLNLIKHNLSSDCLLSDGVAQPCLMILMLHSCVDDVITLKYPTLSSLYNGENLEHCGSDLYDTLDSVLSFTSVVFKWNLIFEIKLIYLFMLVCPYAEIRFWVSERYQIFPCQTKQVEAQVAICTVKGFDTHVLICHSCLSQVIKLWGWKNVFSRCFTQLSLQRRSRYEATVLKSFTRWITFSKHGTILSGNGRLL